MKHNYLKHLFTALLLLVATVASAQSFEVDGIFYNILSEEEKTVEVTFKGLYGENSYTGDVVIPATVTKLETVTTVLKTFDTWTSTNKNNSTTSQTSYTLNVEAGNILKFDWSVSSESNYDWLIITLDGTEIVKKSGIFSGNYEKTFTTAGVHTLLVKYTKDGSVNKDNDEGKIYNITLGTANGNENEIVYRVTTIGNGAFSYCIYLESIEIPNSVTTIGNYAFRNCGNLKSVIIGNSVTTIGNYAFDDCENLKRVIIGNSVTSIGNWAFQCCKSLNSIEIPNSVTTVGYYAFYGCSNLRSVIIGSGVISIGNNAFSNLALRSVTSLIPADILFAVTAFSAVDKNACILCVPLGAKETYSVTAGWNEFKTIVELGRDRTVSVNRYGCGTYCSPFALDFRNVEGIKAYCAIGYKPSTKTVTLARVMTVGAGQGVFIKGDPGEYIVPVIDNFDEHTLNMLVGTLEQTTVNSTDGEMNNYKFTILPGDETPMFYPFEDNTTLSAGKAYLQIPTAWLPAVAQKSVSIRFDEGETTDIDEVADEVKGENGKVKGVCYDMQGRVVENPTSGIYIIDGKKVIIK